MLYLLEHCETPRDDDLFLELLDRACHPKVSAPEPPGPADDHVGPFQAAIDDPYNRLDRDLWSRRRHLAADLLSIVDGHLRRVHRIEAVAGNPDPHGGRAAIEDHEQNRGVSRTDFLIDAARDLYEILASDSPQTAVGYLHSWAASRWGLLNRLAIHGWGQRTDISADNKIEWLLNQDGWINDDRMHHETMRLIAQTVHKASEGTVRALTIQIASDPETNHPQAVFNALGWIAQHARSSPQAQSAFARAQAANPDWEMLEHPDFLRWAEAANGTDGMYPQDLADSLTVNPAASVAGLFAVAERNMPLNPMTYEWAVVLGAVRQATRLSAGAGLALLEALAVAPGSEPEASRDLASSALRELVRQSTLQEATREHWDRIGPLLAALWDAGTAHWGLSTRPSPSRGWLDEANNSWPGNLARLLVQKISSQMQADPESWAGLPSDDKHLLETIIASDSHEARLVQATCAHNLAFLHAADRRWTAQNILPLLDPAADEQRSVRCWDSCPRLPREPDLQQLLDDGLMAHFTVFAQRPNRRGQDAPQGFARFAADLCLATSNTTESEPAWLKKFSANATDATRTNFTRSIAHLLRDTAPEKREAQWHKWMHDYWRDRLTCVPRDLTEQEASALADWVILLDDDFPVAVDLVLQSPASLQKESMLPSRMLDVTRGYGPFKDLLDRYPQAVARLIAHLLTNTDQQIAQHSSIPVTGIIRDLRARTDEATFEPVREQLLRLGWSRFAPE